MMSLIDGTAFQRALTVAVLFIVIFSAYASAAPSPAITASTLMSRMEPEKRAELMARACDANNNLTTALNNLLTNIIPQLGPTLDGLNGSANSLGQAIPILGELISFLNMACLGTGI
ncbi:hypothetical protein FA10DRAFT_298678 [Acaromyces ingoldii]|uniref:Uncharacterized protein n=1 Tax=Acaromyces ingoldii TaxID=215250 RepID=A0A316YUM2_9BASI|nr:hypothetical protein FA10DRAFT_298678 [Acaromyces ingoldii]PWN93270.1 hypothetical protein FA10DRAFT_298678 [Acaromyces ingoldii]